MNIDEACKILEVSDNISDEDLKKHYKRLAAKYHPDICKDQDKFKEINSAYQFITDYRANPHKYQQNNFHSESGGINFNFSNFADFFGNHGNPQAEVKPIELSLNISFHESVFGCTKNVKYSRNTICNLCSGSGDKKISNGCKDCNGFGMKTINRNNFIVSQPCNVCKGANIKHEQCKSCKDGFIAQNIEQSIEIPPGVKGTDQHIIIRRGGNYFTGMFGQLSCSDVVIKLNIEKHPEMEIFDKDIQSKINISLVDALIGRVVEVDTAYGKKDLVVPPKSRNADVVSLDNCGVANAGKHLVRLDVSYPDDIDSIVKAINGNSSSV